MLSVTISRRTVDFPPTGGLRFPNEVAVVLSRQSLNHFNSNPGFHTHNLVNVKGVVHTKLFFSNPNSHSTLTEYLKNILHTWDTFIFTSWFNSNTTNILETFGLKFVNSPRFQLIKFLLDIFNQIAKRWIFQNVKSKKKLCPTTLFSHSTKYRLTEWSFSVI